MATSQLREVIAWARNSSSGASALISDEMTLLRYCSTPASLIAVIVPSGLEKEPQPALEGLILLPFPVEVDPDGHAAQGEGGLPFRRQSDLRSPGEFLSLLPQQHQAALIRPDRELPAQRGLVREDEPAIQNAACLGLALIDANRKKGLLIDHTIEPEDSALLTVARAS